MALKMYKKKGPTWEQLRELRGIFKEAKVEIDTWWVKYPCIGKYFRYWEETSELADRMEELMSCGLFPTPVRYYEYDGDADAMSEILPYRWHWKQIAIYAEAWIVTNGNPKKAYKLYKKWSGYRFETQNFFQRLGWRTTCWFNPDLPWCTPWMDLETWFWRKGTEIRHALKLDINDNP
jgi:hypothetical protein